MEKPETLNLCSIPMLKEVLGLLHGNKLSSLCRILSITMSDLDTLEHTKNLLAQNKEKRSNNDLMQTTRELNQELVMSIPGLLKKILDLAVNEQYFPRHADVCFRNRISGGIPFQEERLIVDCEENS